MAVARLGGGGAVSGRLHQRREVVNVLQGLVVRAAVRRARRAALSDGGDGGDAIEELHCFPKARSF